MAVSAAQGQKLFGQINGTQEFTVHNHSSADSDEDGGFCSQLVVEQVLQLSQLEEHKVFVTIIQYDGAVIALGFDAHDVKGRDTEQVRGVAYDDFEFHAVPYVVQSYVFFL